MASVHISVLLVLSVDVFLALAAAGNPAGLASGLGRTVAQRHGGLITLHATAAIHQTRRQEHGRLACGQPAGAEGRCERLEQEGVLAYDIFSVAVCLKPSPGHKVAARRVLFGIRWQVDQRQRTVEGRENS